MKEYDSDAIDSGGNDSSDVDLALIVIQMKSGGGGGGGGGGGVIQKITASRGDHVKKIGTLRVGHVIFKWC